MLPLLVLALVGEAPPLQFSVLRHLLIGRTSANCSAQVVVVDVLLRGGSDLGVAGQILLGADDGHVGNQHLWRLEDGDEIKVLVLGPGATESGLLESGPW